MTLEHPFAQSKQYIWQSDRVVEVGLVPGEAFGYVQQPKSLC